MADVNIIFKQLSRCAESKEHRDASQEQKDYRGELSALSGLLMELRRGCDAQEAIDVEGACILFEKAHYARTPEEEQRYDKQLDDLASAERSLELVKDPERYRAFYEDKIARRGITPGSLPSGESYEMFAERQARYLGSSKSGFSEAEEKDLFTSRQAVIQAGLKDFKSLQRAALFPDVVRVEREVEALAREMGIDDPKIWAEPRTDGQDYKGEIVHVDEERGYLVQHNGKKGLYVHHLDRLSKTPEISENVKISYPKDQTQKATIETVERQRGRSVQR
ncbi:MAG: hypothetical protein IJR14_03960 [Synergistaceae bacterium]|nr:hypothetical protein [Synergistaceae bacterium]